MSASTTTRTSAADRVYDHVKSAILGGDREGGSFLTEGEVADEVGVSRTPVREALLRLQVEGLVTLYPKKGALVTSVTARDAREVLEARQVIEEWAAGRAWSRRADLVEMLEPALEAMRAARQADDPGAFSTADRTFHELIVDAAGNGVISRHYSSLRDRQLCILAGQIRAGSGRMKHALDTHGELLELLRSGTRAQFVKASREHVADAMQRLGVGGDR